jgi:dipeptidyl aminopeptidase/acylaminoacyl peptidase
MAEELPYGSWPSPITPDVVVAGSVSLGGPAWQPTGADGSGWLWWSELRPEEKGRVQLVRRRVGPDGRPTGDAVDVLPDGFSARTRVHEYGGGAWWLGRSNQPDVVHFTSWDDQRLYRYAVGAAAPVAVTPEPPVRHGLRYADAEVTPDGHWIVCVRERHPADGSEAVNEIVAVAADGDGTAEPRVLVSGPDFVSCPRVSRDGTHLAWVQWNHPNMPWDDTSLWVGELSWTDGPRIESSTVIDPALGRSWMTPRWLGDDHLYAIADPDDFWILRDFRPIDGSWALTGEPLSDPAHESGAPQWVFGSATYCLLPGGGGANAYVSDGVDRLEVFELDGERRGVDVPFTSMGGLTVAGDRIAMLAASFTTEPEVVTVDPTTGDVITIRPARDLGIDPTWFAVPRHISFPTTDDGTAHGFFYPPTSATASGPADARPPLLVLSHGGPTGAARPQLQLNIQFWTSRGFGVVDVNYRGSTGYGRRYRDALHDKWGIYDTDDCIAAARYLAAAGDVDGDRLAIRGGSAGGYTTLCALTFHDDFTVGSSLYGVADLEALATDTHKFESRYLDLLVGPYPADKQVYEDRSPIHHVDRLDTPLVIFQGLEDAIVPPAQAEMMVTALRERGVPFAYLPFEGEQHGFRQAANIRRVLEAELYFFGQILDFRPDDEVEPVAIENL